MRPLFIILFVFSLFNHTNSQNTIDLNDLPQVSEIIFEISQNNSADTVIIGLHGGPLETIDTGDFNFFNSIQTYNLIEVKKHHHDRPDIKNDSNLTLSEAQRINDSTSARIRKVVNHYHDLGKKIVLIGNSFGAFCVTEYIEDYGFDHLYKAIAMVGRLNLDTEIVNSYANGHYALFEADGETHVFLNEPPYNQPSFPDDWALMKITASMGANRFTDSLSGIDLSNFMFVHGTADRAVGKLDSVELNFLNTHHATVFATPEQTHESALLDQNMLEVLNFIRTNTSTSSKSNNFQQPSIEIINNSILIEPSVSKQANLNIFDLQGKIQYSQTIHPNKKMHLLPELQSGIYLISIEGYRSVKKFFVQ